MNVTQAEEIYFYNDKRSEFLMNSMGNDPQVINAIITHAYAALSQKEPAFLWFAMGALVSSAVGKNLDFAKQVALKTGGQTDTPKAIEDNLGAGNQNIFKEIFPLFLTYQKIGSEGMQLLAKSENVSSNPLKNEEFLDAFENYALLQSRQATIAASLALPLNDPGVIKQLFLDKKNAELAHSIAMQIAGQEQGTVQDIYAANLVEIMLDPTLSSIGHLFQLDEIRILDKSFVFSDYVKNPADIEQRLKFAEVLFKAAEKGFGEGQFPEYQEKVLQAAEQTLWWGNPYVAPLKSSEANNAYWGPLYRTKLLVI